MLSQWPKCTLPALTRRVQWPVRIGDRGKNDKVRRFEKNPTVPCIYWPISGSAAMHVVLAKKKSRCFPGNKPRFTKCDHVTLRPLISQLKEALSWTHYPSVEVEGRTCCFHPEGLTVLEASLKRWKLFIGRQGVTPHRAWIFIIGFSRRWNRFPRIPIL